VHICSSQVPSGIVGAFQVHNFLVIKEFQELYFLAECGPHGATLRCPIAQKKGEKKKQYSKTCEVDHVAKLTTYVIWERDVTHRVYINGYLSMLTTCLCWPLADGTDGGQHRQFTVLRPARALGIKRVLYIPSPVECPLREAFRDTPDATCIL
jgi:hypothetical protein